MKSAGSNASTKFSMNVPSIDLGTWRGGKQDPPVFGHDISIIEKSKDLSLIEEEEDNDEEIGLSTSRRKHSSINNQRYSSRSSHVVSNTRRASSSKSCMSNYRGGGIQVSSHHTGYNELDASTNDVLSDLKNLSIQIEKERNSRKHSRFLKIQK